MVGITIGMIVLVLLVMIPAAFKFVALGKPKTRQTVGALEPADQIPTIFLPGYFGNRFSFGRLLNRLSLRYQANKSMVVKVDLHGRIRIRGTISQSRPMIQVLFANKLSRPEQQATWLADICRALHDRYGVNQVNLVGHSMGCITIFWFLTHQSATSMVTVKRVVAIAGPFNDSEIARSTSDIDAYPLNAKGPVKKMPIYRALSKRVFAIPKDIQVLNIAGRISNLQQDDGQVSLNSAFSLRYLLRAPVEQYRELVIHGKRATHRLLNENSEVDEGIAKFIWNL